MSNKQQASKCNLAVARIIQSTATNWDAHGAIKYDGQIVESVWENAPNWSPMGKRTKESSDISSNAVETRGLLSCMTRLG